MRYLGKIPLTQRVKIRWEVSDELMKGEKTAIGTLTESIQHEPVANPLDTCECSCIRVIHRPLLTNYGPERICGGNLSPLCNLAHGFRLKTKGQKLPQSKLLSLHVPATSHRKRQRFIIDPKDIIELEIKSS